VEVAAMLLLLMPVPPAPLQLTALVRLLQRPAQLSSALQAHAPV
jgi:hypothetical protein